MNLHSKGNSMNSEQNTPTGRLAILQDEKAKRQSAAVVEAEKLKTALVRLSVLRAQSELDGTDLSVRIAEVEKQVAHAETVIGSWPDVSAELDRRIADVEVEIQNEQAAALMAEYDQIVAGEKARRVTWAQSLVVTAERAQEFQANMDRRKVIADKLRALGQTEGVDIGDASFGHFPKTELGTLRGVDNARQWLHHVENDTWANAMI